MDRSLELTSDVDVDTAIRSSATVLSIPSIDGGKGLL